MIHGWGLARWCANGLTARKRLPWVHLSVRRIDPARMESLTHCLAVAIGGGDGEEGGSRRDAEGCDLFRGPMVARGDRIASVHPTVGQYRLTEEDRTAMLEAILTDPEAWPVQRGRPVPARHVSPRTSRPRCQRRLSRLLCGVPEVREGRPRHPVPQEHASQPIQGRPESRRPTAPRDRGRSGADRTRGRGQGPRAEEMIMAQKKATGQTGPGSSRGIGAASKCAAGGPRAAGAGREPELARGGAGRSSGPSPASATLRLAIASRWRPGTRSVRSFRSPRRRRWRRRR